MKNLTSTTKTRLEMRRETMKCKKCKPSPKHPIFTVQEGTYIEFDATEMKQWNTIRVNAVKRRIHYYEGHM